MRDITFWVRYIPSYCGGRFVPVLFRHSRHCCLNPCGDGSLDVKERLLFATFYIFILQTDSELPFEGKVKLYHMQMLG